MVGADFQGINGLAKAPTSDPLRVHPMGAWGAGAGPRVSSGPVRVLLRIPRPPPGSGCLSRGRSDVGPFSWCGR